MLTTGVGEVQVMQGNLESLRVINQCEEVKAWNEWRCTLGHFTVFEKFKAHARVRR
jgi:hypothetical protein